VHGAIRKRPLRTRTLGAEQQAAAQVGLFEILGNGLRGTIVKPDGAALIAFLAQGENGFPAGRCGLLEDSSTQTRVCEPALLA
jgi:hypothetical protein